MPKKPWPYLAFLLLAVFLTISWLGSRPSVGKISLNPQPLPTIKPISPKLYQGKTVSFCYLDNQDIRIDQDFDQTGIGKIDLFGAKGDSSHYLISVNQVNTSSLSDISAVTYRQQAKETYQQENIRVANLNSLYFTKKDKSEFIVFTIKNRKLFTIALTVHSNDPRYEYNFLDFVKKFEIFGDSSGSRTHDCLDESQES